MTAAQTSRARAVQAFRMRTQAANKKYVNPPGAPRVGTVIQPGSVPPKRR